MPRESLNMVCLDLPTVLVLIICKAKIAEIFSDKTFSAHYHFSELQTKTFSIDKVL